MGTMILIVLGCGACASVNLKQSYGRGSNWWYISISWGLAVTMGVYVAGFLGSQGHLNPAVTIPYAIFGLFPWHSVLPYLSGQFLGTRSSMHTFFNRVSSKKSPKPFCGCSCYARNSIRDTFAWNFDTFWGLGDHTKEASLEHIWEIFPSSKLWDGI